MKKILILLLAALALCAGAGLIAYFAVPVAAGAILLANGITLTCKTLGLPRWLAALGFLALLPTAVYLAVKAFSAKSRKWVTLVLIVAAVIYALVTAVLGNQHLVAAAQRAAASVHKQLAPIKPADPASEPWFNPDGSPRLFYVHPAASNVWRFYQGAYLAGSHDPLTGAELQPVTPVVRQEWEAARQMEQEQAAAAQRATEERQHEHELAVAAQKQAEEQRTAEAVAAEKSRLEQQVAAQQQKVDELLQKLQESAQQRSQPRAEQPQPDPPAAPAYAVPSVSTTTYVVNGAPPQPVYYYYAPPPPPRVTYYYYYPTVRTYWVAPRPYVFVPSAPRYYFRRW